MSESRLAHAGITIWHNPRCSKSRETLQLLRDNDIVPHVFLYLEITPSTDQIRAVCSKLNISPKDLVRRNEIAYRSLATEEKESDELLIQAMVRNPIIIERPIVINADKAAIGRPPENILQII